jgi:hypothetical protein
MFLIFIFVSTSCEKTSDDNISIRTYIKQLKSGSYNLQNAKKLPDLPAFEPADIPELLVYADDKQIITGFPHNPLSSYFEPDCRLGVYILWTIESIRLVSNGKNLALGRFPSLNPIIGVKGIGSYDTIDNDTIHQATVQAYNNWWNSNSDFEQIKTINPLENTIYGWF